VEDRVRQAAVEIGLSEALTYGFVAEGDLEKLGAPPPVVKLKNPLSEERNVMRTSLLPGLLEALRRATRRGVSDVRLFTAARCYCDPSDEATGLPTEQRRFAAVVAGNRARALTKPEPVDVFDAKGVALALIERASGHQARVERGAAAYLHPRGAAELYVGDVNLGRFGPLHPDVSERFDLDGSCMVVEVDLDALAALGYQMPRYQPIPVLPAATRDIALVVSQDVSAGELTQAIRTAAGELCESIVLFDRFCGKGVPEEHQSLAYHLVFRDPKAALDPENARTLTDQEVDKVAEKLLSTVKQQFSATVRGA
jgi:phenylalanyl-tRNA synthetase beta chain